MSGIISLLCMFFAAFNTVESQWGPLYYSEVSITEATFIERGTAEAASLLECAMKCTAFDRGKGQKCNLFIYSTPLCRLGALAQLNQEYGPLKAHYHLYQATSNPLGSRRVGVLFGWSLAKNVAGICEFLGGKIFEPRSNEELQWLGSVDMEGVNAYTWLGVQLNSAGEPALNSTGKAIDPKIKVNKGKGEECFKATIRDPVVSLRAGHCDSGNAMVTCEW